jgi:hypothetical protein
MTPNTPHEAFRRLAAMAVDFELAPEQRRELEAHLTGCGECRRFTSALAGDRTLLRDRRREIPPRRLEDAVLALDGTTGWSRPAFRFGLSWAAVAVALLSLALLASVAFVGARLLLRPPVTDIVQPGPAGRPLGDLPVLGRISATIAVPIGDAAGGHLCHVIAISDCATAIAASDDAVWVSKTDGVARIDPASNLVVSTIGLGAFPRAIAVANGVVWVAVAGDQSVVAIDAATNRIAGTVGVGGIPAALAIDARAVWAVVGDQIVEIDPSTYSVRSHIRLPGIASAMAAVDGVLVLTLTNADSIAFVDEASGIATQVLVENLGAPWQVRASGETVWYAGHDQVGEVDMATRTISRTILAPNQPALAVGPGPGGSTSQVWLASVWNRGVEDIDPALGRAVSGLSIDAASHWNASIAVLNGSLWVRLYDPEVTLRITPDQPTQ